MTTETTMEPTTTTKAVHWAATLGAEVAARRAARQAEAAAEQEASGQRAAVPAVELTQRAMQVAALVVEAIDLFAAAAEIAIEADPPSPAGVQLRTTNNRLRLLRADDRLDVEFRGRSRAETRLFDLAPEDFSAEATARTIAQEWITQLAAEEGLHHVTR